jgi:hypothetical protein
VCVSRGDGARPVMTIFLALETGIWCGIDSNSICVARRVCLCIRRAALLSIYVFMMDPL